MTGSRGKGLDVDSPNKTYDSRYKVKKGEKGGSTSPNNNHLKIIKKYLKKMLLWSLGQEEARNYPWKKNSL
jgi:hypothetical protein